jgi:hypothetical protein
MKIINCEQGTNEWLEARRCMITGTKLESVMGTNWDRLMLACELIAEEATEQVKSMKVSSEMERGTAEEVFARKHFEKITKKKVKQIGFCVSDEFDYLGCSGDGWIENKKELTEALEIKCPDTKQAVFYNLASQLSPEILGLGSWSAITKLSPEPKFKPSSKVPFAGIPEQYKWQVVNYFLVNEKLEKLNFAIYDPRFLDEKSIIHTIVVEKNNPLLQEAISEAKEELVKFRKFWLDCRNIIIKDNF